MNMLGKDGLIMNYKEYDVNKQKPVTASYAMVTRLYVKKTRTNYFGFGKKKEKEKEHILVEEWQLGFRVHTSTKEIDFARRRKKKKKEKNS